MRAGIFVHKNCRNLLYPQSLIERFPVPDQFVFWFQNYPEYAPIFYESPVIKGKPWADPDKNDVSFHPQYNAVDGNINRISFSGIYEVHDKIPINPFGRTGIIGRGLLGRWGPNHAADPIVTKWKRDSNGTILTDVNSKRNILQMIAIQRKDNNMWAIPGGMVDPGEKISATLKREFIEEALNSNTGLAAHIKDAFFDQNRIKIYCGYVDDPRNTDNAWMETSAYNFHDEIGNVIGSLKFQAGDDAGNVKWLDIDQHVNLYANHRDIVQKVVEKLDAHW